MEYGECDHYMEEATWHSGSLCNNLEVHLAKLVNIGTKNGSHWAPNLTDGTRFQWRDSPLPCLHSLHEDRWSHASITSLR